MEHQRQPISKENTIERKHINLHDSHPSPLPNPWPDTLTPGLAQYHLEQALLCQMPLSTGLTLRKYRCNNVQVQRCKPTNDGP